MKGVILAGGSGSRLGILTRITNKHLLPVWKKPMIYYPIETLISAGIRDILIVSGTEHAGDFLRLLGSGKEFGARFSYEIQEGNTGIAKALELAEIFVGNDKFVVVLGDNIFEDDFKNEVENFMKGKFEAKVFLKEVEDPERFGVAEITGDKIIDIKEKPKNPKTNFAVTGLYMYDPSVFGHIKTLKPSARGEYEITDVNNHFVKKNSMTFAKVKGFWTDAGTFPSLWRATNLIKEKEEYGKK